jgi:hypothetical protein
MEFNNHLELTSQVADVRIGCPYQKQTDTGFCMIGANGDSICVPSIGNGQFITGDLNILKSRPACSGVRPNWDRKQEAFEGYEEAPKISKPNCAVSQYICANGTCAGSELQCGDANTLLGYMPKDSSIAILQKTSSST